MLSKFCAVLGRLLPLAIAGLALTAGCAAAEPTQDPESTLSHDEFWRQALASRPALDVQKVGVLHFHGIQIERLLYSGSTWQGKAQRVYAIYAHPEGKGPFPAILQIHGGGQSCYPANVAYFVEHGYACLAFDWTGPHAGRADDAVTHWAKGVGGNLFGSDGEDPRRLVIFHATLAAIGGIDILASRPEVDADRIGIEGVSWGGFLCWPVNGLDARVKVAVPVYGLGNLDQQWNQMGQALGSKTAKWREIYDRLLDAGGFTATQHGAIMFCSGANDFFGPQDLAEARLAQLSVDHRRSYGPNRMHNIDEGTALAAVAWLDAHLKPGAAPFPAEPQVALSTDGDGQLLATVTPDAAQTVRNVRIDFARGGRLPLLRCWQSVEAKKGEAGNWSAEVPLIDGTQSVAITAQVFDEHGMMLSSAVQTLRPAVALAVRPRPTGMVHGVISPWQPEFGGWYSHTGTDLYDADPPPGRLEPGEIDGHRAILYRPAGRKGEAKIATRLPVDPGVEYGNRNGLAIWVHDAQSLTVSINFFLREPNAREYEAKVKPGPGWQRVVLKLSDFVPYYEDKSKGGVEDEPPLAEWDELHSIDLVMSCVPNGTLAVGEVAWQKPHPASAAKP